MLDGTVMGKGGLTGRRVMTPAWLTIVPNEPDWLDHDKLISVNDSVLISLHLAGNLFPPLSPLLSSPLLPPSLPTPLSYY
jgi:hypothetical protein